LDARSANIAGGDVPRKYNLGKRARAVAQTRARIVEAAMALYRAQPIAATSMHEVARRADVAPATVLNHFPSHEELAQAVVEELLRTLRPPTSAIFLGLDTVPQRLRALARALSAFFERSEPWFAVHEREHRQVTAFGAGARRFDADVVELVRLALAPIDGVWEVAAVRALLSPPVFGGLRRNASMTAEQAADLVTDILVAWVDGPRAGTTNTGGAR
jgi:AcrR family transcriptional regulator